MPEFAKHIEASFHRLAEARDIADNLRHNAPAHRAAMNAVFVLEDVYAALVGMQDAQTNASQYQRE